MLDTTGDPDFILKEGNVRLTTKNNNDAQNHDPTSVTNRECDPPNFDNLIIDNVVKEKKARGVDYHIIAHTV